MANHESFGGTPAANPRDTETPALEVTLPLAWLETPTSAVSRHAALNGLTARQLCGDYLISFDKISEGDPVEVRRLSTFLAADFEALMSAAPQRIEKGWFSLNGAVVSRAHSRRTRLRFCPICASESIKANPGIPADAAVPTAAPTLVDPIRTCPLHNVPYVFIENSPRVMKGQTRDDFGVALSELLEDLAPFVEAAIPREFSGFERLIMGRLNYGPLVSSPLLDLFDISTVATVCERFGAFMMHGPRGLVTSMSDDELWAAAQAGYEMLLLGPQGIHAMVDSAFADAAREQRNGMASTVFGRLHSFLNSEEARGIEPVLQIFVDKLSEYLPYGPDAPPIYGVRPKTRHRHSLQSAERAYGVPCRTIQRRLEQSGELERLGDGKFFSVRVAVLDDLYRSADTLLSRAQVIEVTGAHAHDFFALEACELICPRAAEKLRYRYRRGDIHDVVDRLSAGAKALFEETGDFVSVRHAHQNSSWWMADIYRFVATREVRYGILQGQKALSGLRVNLPDLIALHPLFGVPHLSVVQAARRLKVGTRVVQLLAAEGLLTKYEVRDGRAAKMHHGFPTADVERFAEQYISAHEMVQRGMPPFANIRLSEMGIWPVFKSKQFRTNFYDRQELLPLLPR